MLVQYALQLGYRGIGAMGSLPGEDLARALRIAAGAGYCGVEVMADLVGDDAGVLARAAAAHNLGITGYHVFYEDTELSALVADVEKLRTANVMVSASCVDWGMDEYLRLAKWLRVTSRALADHGVGLHYHPHDSEYKPLQEGVAGVSVLADRCRADEMNILVDTYWARQGGREAAEVIEEYSHRVNYVHFKANGDDSNFESSMLALHGTPEVWAVVEEDRPGGDLEPWLSGQRSMLAGLAAKHGIK